MTLYAQSLEAMERELLPRVLGECGWNECAAAEAMGINRGTLSKKLKALGICMPADAKVRYRTHGLLPKCTAIPKPNRSAVTGVIREVVAQANARSA